MAAALTRAWTQVRTRPSLLVVSPPRLHASTRLHAVLGWRQRLELPVFQGWNLDAFLCVRTRPFRASLPATPPSPASAEDRPTLRRSVQTSALSPWRRTHCPPVPAHAASCWVRPVGWEARRRDQVSSHGCSQPPAFIDFLPA